MSQFDPKLPPQPPPFAPPDAPYATPLGYSPPPPPKSSATKILLIVLAVVLVGGVFACGCMVSILLPSLNRAREQANRVKCASNLRQIGQGVQMYANNHGGQCPDTFEQLLVDQDLSPDVFVCHSTTDSYAPGATAQAQAANLSKGGHLSYVYAGKGLTQPGSFAASRNIVLAYEPLTNHTSQGVNMLFADGHVAFVPAAQAKQIITDLQAGKNPPSLTGF